MIGKVRIIYNDVTKEELQKIMQEYDSIVDLRPSTSEPLERILGSGNKQEKEEKPKNKKPLTKINMW